MHALLAKEFRLVVHPATYMLVVLGALVLIPSWPYAVIILYGILMAFFNAQNAREMRDLSYSFALPASRRDMVRVRVLVMIIIELAMTAIMALCICLRPVLGIDAVAATQPMVGLPANVALLGFTLATSGIFNLVFFALYFRNPTKIGVPFLLACVPVRCVRGGPVHPSRGLRTHQYAGIWKPWRPAHRAIRGHRALRRAQRACNQARLARLRHVRRINHARSCFSMISYTSFTSLPTSSTPCPVVL